MMYPISNLLDYLEKERFEHGLIVAQHAHIHFFYEAGLTHIASLPRSGPSGEVRAHIADGAKDFEVTYVGPRWSPTHLRRNRMVRHLERNLPRLGIPFYVHPRCSRAEWLNVVSRSRITVVSSLNGQFTPQIFNVMHAGSLCLVDELSPQTGVYRFFEPGRHFVTWRDFDDLLDKIRYYAKHADEAAEIAHAGQTQAEVHFPSARRYGVAISEFVFEDKIDPQLRGTADPRCMEIRSSNREFFYRRVRLYENMQELHRIHEKLSVLFLEVSALESAADLADLPRLHLACGFSDLRSKAYWEARFGRAKVLDRIRCFSIPDLMKGGPTQYDVGVLEAGVPEADWSATVAEMSTLLKRNALLWVWGEPGPPEKRVLEVAGFRPLPAGGAMCLTRLMERLRRWFWRWGMYPYPYVPLRPPMQMVPGLSAYLRGWQSLLLWP